MDKNSVLVAGAILFKETKKGPRWFLVKYSSEHDWEIAKAIVRKGESSVRAALRMMGEQGGMGTRVIEEAGRAGGVTSVNGKVLPQRYIYYLMIQKSASEIFGFNRFSWFDYPRTMKLLSSKREKLMFKLGKKQFDEWKKRQKGQSP